MSECIKRDSGPDQNPVERLFGFQQALLVLSAHSVVSNPRWEYHIFRLQTAPCLS